MFNGKKLRGRIVEICGTIKRFAELMGMADGTLNARLKGVGWKRDEIVKCAEVLQLQSEDIQTYFFANIVR